MVTRQFQVNDSFFDLLTKENQAYFLGFLSGDGTVYRRSVILTLARLDRNHLLKYKTALSADSPIRDFDQYLPDEDKYYPSSQVRFTSQHMVDTLDSYGITPCKSLTLCPCDSIPAHLIRHYIRGIFDADGSIHEYELPSGLTNWAIQFAGTKPIMQYIADWLHETDPYIDLKTPHPNANIFALAYKGLQLPKTIARLIYGDATIYLDRKYEKMTHLLAQPEVREDWSHLNEENLIQLKEQFGTWVAVAEYLGMDPSYLDQARVRIGGSVKPPARTCSANLAGTITKEVLAAAYAETGTYPAAAKKLGIGTVTIYKYVRQFFPEHIKPRVAKNPEAMARLKQMTPEQFAELKQLHGSWANVAAALDVHESAFTRIRLQAKS